MKRAMEALNTAQHKAAEAMYTNGERGGARRPRTPDSPAAARAVSPAATDRIEGDVIDAEVVEEEKK